MGLGLGKDKKPNVKVKEDMDKDLCKKLDGEVLDLSNGGTACVFARDDNGKPVEIDLENITPEIREKIEKKTGESLR